VNAHEKRKFNRLVKSVAAALLEEDGSHKPESRIEPNTAEGQAGHREAGSRKTWWDRFRVRAVWTTRWLWKATIFFGFWLGILSGYISLLPKISVVQNEQLDPSDPFSSPFIVSNDGPLPIENVRFRCGIGSVSYYGKVRVKGAENYGSSFMFAPDAHGNLPVQNFGSPEMNPGERSTIPSCNYPLPKDVSDADIGIVLEFRIGYTPFPSTRTFRFHTLPDANHGFHWYPYPLK